MRIAILTTGRQDWGILRSTSLLLRDDPRFDLRLIVGGMHCRAEFGFTEHDVATDGFVVSERLDWMSTGAETTADAGRALEMVGAALLRQAPDALVLVGDRYETAAAAVSATVERVPIVHVHGGEETGGAFDDAFRNAITKLAHLHLVSHPEHAQRIEGMGEDPATIHVVGGPGIDNVHREDLPSRDALATDLGIELRSPVVVVAIHPTTLAANGATATDEVTEMLRAMNAVAATYVITLPNSDPGHLLVRRALSKAATNSRVVVEALGDRRYWGLLKIADALLGNSSSALIEAPAIALPAVNIGDRQLGRLRGDNVIDAPADALAIEAALRTALEPSTRARLTPGTSPFGDGHSAKRIVEVLAAWTPPLPPRKAPVRIIGEPRPPHSAARKDLVLIGGGEHARSVLDAALREATWNVLGYVDPTRSSEMEARGVPWLGDDQTARPTLAGRACVLAVGAGSNGSRETVLARYTDSEIVWASIVHPTAVVAGTATVEPGAVVLARAIVNDGASIGVHAIVNSGAIVEHDVAIGPFSHMGPGAIAGGAARIGRGASIGLGARIRDHIEVGDGAVVGMGAVVLQDVPAGVTVVGVPARAVSSAGDERSEKSR